MQNIMQINRKSALLLRLYFCKFVSYHICICLKNWLSLP